MRVTKENIISNLNKAQENMLEKRLEENKFLILCDLVEKWAAEKGILEKATPETQAQKTLEEVNELIDAIDNNDELETKDAIGDILVTLIIQCKMQNMDILGCLNSAYNVIKNRTGRMENGTFVKDK